MTDKQITDNRIDAGKAFDWGRTSEDYAKYRDIYPKLFYQKIADKGLCIKGQRVLDLGTGTGVLPRNMYHYGAKWMGIDISPEQIEQAKRLTRSAGMNIEYRTVAAEKMGFSKNSFDVITACQCFHYFDYAKLMPALSRVLKDNGKFLILYMEWLPFEDDIAGASEKLVLKYNPQWSGAGFIRKPLTIPENDCFVLESHEEYDIKVPFTRDSWNGRMKACRGIGASLADEEIAKWEKEHLELLKRIAPKEFEILHYVAMAVLSKSN